ncbi:MULTISPECIES: hypothetical protein [unclassified Pantoea]|jgi:hypothetical protein|uniref:hypothetical protein n=1 Tax=unclassified Pantoea TaxID=2630326 RepID=UPI000D92F79C|nr:MULTISPECIES: hypothetical protein [unclassified Pantoea]MBD9646157.1 hypothetical protein [Pantoea sp. PNT02]MBY4954209.1 hypothetical protein [Pantoea sp. DY-17]PYG47949.1 hypothetical protein DEU53_107132 [Pantoea sp. AG1095]WFL67224.1 hypothetical protein P6287_18080 [Pantoea sp. X85]WGK56972.1 hypothetical protein PO881_17995 [Pantoea sp. SS70]
MYHSDLILKGIKADELMASQLEKALIGVKDQVLQQASKIGDGATRLVYYTSCFTDNYQDVCAKLKEEDLRFLDGIAEVVKRRDIIYRLVHIYFEEIFRFKTREQLSAINSGLLKAGVIISSNTLNNQTFIIGITTAVCLGIGFNSSIVAWTGKTAALTVTGLGLYGIVQQAADSAERLRLQAPMYYQALHMQRLEMMYFLVEPTFMKAQAFESDITNAIINMVK